jgi:site-specific recombinase XerC
VLSVTIDGKPVEVPEGIGRDENCIRPLHTRGDGNVYVIYSRPIRFTLLDLLRLWNLDTEGYEISIWVKGKGQQEFINIGSDPAKVAIEDGLNIRLELRSR